MAVKWAEGYYFSIQLESIFHFLTFVSKGDLEGRVFMFSVSGYSNSVLLTAHFLMGTDRKDSADPGHLSV